MPLVSLSKGNRDPGGVNGYVTLLQRFLVLNNVLHRNAAGADPVHGDFDAATEAAVMSFQKTSGISITGDVTGQTWAAIAGVSSPLAVVNPSVPSSSLPNLSPGAIDSVVTVLQRLLVEFSGPNPKLIFITPGIITRADVVDSGGVFGPKTTAAVAAFQANRGLPPPFNAEIGPLTWEKLLFPKGRNPVPG
jgi:peptidoglycan hydrolase-like protein with peptidoglycan-binding domain